MPARGIRVLATLIGAAALVAGCSSGNDDSGSGTGGGSASTKYPQAAAHIAKLMQRPSTLNITDPIGKPIPAGRTIAYIQCGSPACVGNGDALDEAAKALGWTVDRINAGLTAESIKAAWGQATSAHPDAVVTSGFSRALFNPELAQLAAAKVPVIDLTTADEPGDGLTAIYGYGPQWATQGQILGDYLLANAGSAPVKALTVTVSAYANLGMIADGLRKEVTGACGDCTVAALDVPVSSIGSDLPSRLTSYLSAHPDINWVYVGFADMVTGLPAALSSAGLGKVKLITIDDTATSQNYMRNGQSLVMSAGFDIHEMMWRAVDYLARTWTGVPTTQNTAVDGLP
ncbi:MAG: ribose transport system substrate-binding protein, partial [Mycobacteriales bacterium]